MKQNFIAAIALLCIAVVVGCSREEAASPSDLVKLRMNDPAYVSKLNEQHKRQKEIQQIAARINSELAKAKAENPDSELVKKLESQREECARVFEANRQQTMKVIGDRMRRDSKISK